MEEIDVETIVQRAREKFPGVTPRIITDNGPQFIAKDFKEFIRIAGMTHVRTSPYYPQSNMRPPSTKMAQDFFVGAACFFKSVRQVRKAVEITFFVDRLDNGLHFRREERWIEKSRTKRNWAEDFTKHNALAVMLFGPCSPFAIHSIGMAASAIRIASPRRWFSPAALNISCLCLYFSGSIRRTASFAVPAPNSIEFSAAFQAL